MKERPIIMSSESVRAILDGRKTQTRRVVKRQDKPIRLKDCPYGKVGDKLWAKETWRPHEEFEDAQVLYLYKADYPSGLNVHWKSSRFMPKKAARIWLEITNIRVERVQDISGGDAQKEGWSREQEMFPTINTDYKAKNWFQTLWDSLNAKRGYDWDKNSWVWVIEFRQMPKENRDGK